MFFVHLTIEFDCLERIVLEVFESIYIFNKSVLLGFIKFNISIIFDLFKVSAGKTIELSLKYLGNIWDEFW